VLSVLTAVAGAILVAGCTGGSDTTTADSRPTEVVDRRVIAVGSGPYDVLWAFRSAWISDTQGLVRLSSSGVVLARIPIPGRGEWSGVASSAIAVYAMQSTGTVARIDPSTNTVTQIVRLPTRWPIDQIAATTDAVCARLDAPAAVDRLRCLDAATLKPLFTAAVAPGPMASDGAGTLWIGGERLVAIHPSGRSIRAVLRARRGASVPALTTYGGHVLAVFSQRRARPELLELGRGSVLRRWTLPRREVVGIAANRSGVWIRSSRPRGSGEISALTPTGGLRPVGHVGAHALGFAAGPHSLWTVNYVLGSATILVLGA
jgi:hypothetical protein